MSPLDPLLPVELNHWYWNLNPRYKMLPYLKHREFAMLCGPKWGEELRLRSCRFLSIRNAQSFSVYMRSTGMNRDSTPYNFYYSIMRYKDPVPLVNCMQREERAPFKARWTTHHHENAAAYDLFLDIDGDFNAFEAAVTSAMLLTGVLDQQHVPYMLRFSGQGFHVHVPYDVIRPALGRYTSFFYEDAHNVMAWCGLVAAWLHDNVSGLIDKKIYDSRRLCKVPYSIAAYPSGERYVCMPIVPADLETFELKNYVPNQAMLDGLRARRGEVLRNAEGNADFLRLIAEAQAKKEGRTRP